MAGFFRGLKGNIMPATSTTAGETSVSPARTEPDETTYTGRFGVRLRELRIAAGMSVEELVIAIEKHNDSRHKSPNARAIYQWEQGTQAPRFDLLPAIAKAVKLKTARNLIPKT